MNDFPPVLAIAFLPVNARLSVETIKVREARVVALVAGGFNPLAPNGGESPKSEGTCALSERTTRILLVLLAALRMPPASVNNIGKR